ncbi:MAG: transketolase [Rhodothermales bacterium]
MSVVAQDSKVTEQTINSIRFLSVDAIQQANSGHPGLPMGAAPMAYAIWKRYLRHNPSNPAWVDRDRFVLSAGHGSMLIYSLLHLTGYDLSIEDLKQFRQLGSKTPGHPENFVTKGVETTTGPLGQGFANGVGMAIAESFLAARFNRPGFNIVDHYTYAIVSDGDLMEGVAAEAASLAGHLGLGKLIYLYDDNDISIDGSTDITFTENVGARFESYNWHVQHIEDGNDVDAITAAIEAARLESERPSMIIVKTTIGFGSPNKQGTAGIHGSPLGDEEIVLTKRNLGWPEDKKFYVPEETREHMLESVKDGEAMEAEWNALFDGYKSAHPKLAEQYLMWMRGEFPAGWENNLPEFEAGGKMATRASSGKVINALASSIDNFVGGSADLSGSNKTNIDGSEDYQKETPGGRYFRFGIREHAMGSIVNGMAAHGGVRPFCGTFLVFSDYMRPAVRLSALMRLPVAYVFTHDSIGQGEDGPTHQPIEHVLTLRAIPNLITMRPGDANEVAYAWRAAIEQKDRPTALVLSRQGMPTFDRSKMGSAAGTLKGGYVLSDDEGTPDVILMATGSEVALIVDAAEILRKEGRNVRVVSMPSWELFDEQPQEYKDSVLLPNVTKRLSVEAATTMGWIRYVGAEGKAFGLDHFGESAPGNVLFEHFGFTPENIANEARSLF